MFCWHDCKLEGPLFSAEFVCLCLSVCLWPALLPFSVDRFWRNLVTRTLLWSSLAANIMVQIGCRETARRLFENFKKFSKSLNSNFKILVHHFLRLCLLCIVKKFDWGRNRAVKTHGLVCLSVYHDRARPLQKRLNRSSCRSRSERPMGLTQGTTVLDGVNPDPHGWRGSFEGEKGRPRTCPNMTCGQYIQSDEAEGSIGTVRMPIEVC